MRSVSDPPNGILTIHVGQSDERGLYMTFCIDPSFEPPGAEEVAKRKEEGYVVAATVQMGRARGNETPISVEEAVEAADGEKEALALWLTFMTALHPFIDLMAAHAEPRVLMIGYQFACELRDALHEKFGDEIG